MGPDTEFPPSVLLLYLLTFAVGAAGLILPLAAGRGRGRSGSRAGLFLQALVVTGILPSLQVLLDAMEITPNLSGAWPLNLTIIFNSLTIAGIGLAATAWSQLTAGMFSLRPAMEKARKAALLLLAVAAVLTMAGQSLALLRPGRFNLALAGRSLTVLMILLLVVCVETTIRSFIRKSEDIPKLVMIPVRGMIPAAIAWTLLYGLLPDRAAWLVPPFGLLSMYVAAMLVLLKLPEHPENGDSIQERVFEDAALTPREKELALMLARGLSYREISEELFVSLSTVQTHVGRIYSKMEVKNKTELSRKLGSGG